MVMFFIMSAVLIVFLVMMRSGQEQAYEDDALYTEVENAWRRTNARTPRQKDHISLQILQTLTYQASPEVYMLLFDGIKQHLRFMFSTPDVRLQVMAQFLQAGVDRHFIDRVWAEQTLKDYQFDVEQAKFQQSLK